MIAQTTPFIPALDDGDPVQQALDFVRQHLDMEVAYISEFVADDVVFRGVSAPGMDDMIKVGDQMPLDQVYCSHILNGDLPELMPDTHQHALARTVPITATIPIRSHISVPLRMQDGSVYGMFCCLSRSKRMDLTDRDLSVMQAFGSVCATHVSTTLGARQKFDDIRVRIQGVLDQRSYHIAFQPIVRLVDGTIVGAEALCRFHAEPIRPPNLWFDEAALVDLQLQLEVQVIETALDALHGLPGHLYLSVNASPSTVATGALAGVFANVDCSRVVLEVTEHAAVDDYDALLAQVAVLRGMGVRVAIDDAGAGFSGLQHIIRMQPDLIKLDMSLTQKIDTDAARRALGGALVRFSAEANAIIVAEGIETQTEYNTLRSLGVSMGQGYLMARPMALADLLLAITVQTTARSA